MMATPIVMNLVGRSSSPSWTRSLTPLPWFSNLIVILWRLILFLPWILIFPLFWRNETFFLQLTSFESLLSFLETFFLFLVLIMTTWIDWNKSFWVGPIGKVHSVTTTSNITLAWKQDQLLERETSPQPSPTTMWMRTSSRLTSTASSSCFPFHPSWCLSATAKVD